MTLIAPYAEQHKDPQGPGDARPTAVQIIEDQGLVASPSWIGRVVLITGCSPGGLGPETAKALHLTGADVYITARTLEKGKQVADDILSDGKPGKVEVIQMDLDSLKSVKAGAEEFLRKSGGKLHVLINNAELMFTPEGKTEDGFETQIGVNHLAHFALTQHLLPALLSSGTTEFNSRVVNVSSGAHRGGRIHISDLNKTFLDDSPSSSSTNPTYDPRAAYCQSKLANILFSNHLNRLYASSSPSSPHHLRSLSLHPGGILTNITRNMSSSENAGMVEENLRKQDDGGLWRIMKTPQQGAATTVWAAVAKELEGKGGIYLDDVAEADGVGEDRKYYLSGVRKDKAFDEGMERELWEVSLGMTGFS